jgi:hypothetical protein
MSRNSGSSATRVARRSPSRQALARLGRVAVGSASRSIQKWGLANVRWTQSAVAIRDDRGSSRRCDLRRRSSGFYERPRPSLSHAHAYRRQARNLPVAFVVRRSKSRGARLVLSPCKKGFNSRVTVPIPSTVVRSALRDGGGYAAAGWVTTSVDTLTGQRRRRLGQATAVRSQDRPPSRPAT